VDTELGHFSIYAFQNYLNYAAASIPETFKIDPIMKRPIGCAPLGMTSLSCNVYTGGFQENPTKILIDYGSAISLISREFFDSLISKPPLHKGKEMTFRTVGGRTKFKQVVAIPVYFYEAKPQPIEVTSGKCFLGGSVTSAHALALTSRALDLH
jgi:hypothetical protein